MLEDATIIYRLSRAPERRVFYVDVGNLSQKNAEMYVKNIMNKYKNRMIYDATTGEVKDTRSTMSMMEDFWLPRRDGTKGTEVSTLPGGQNLGEIEDVEFFKRKVYQSLNVPVSRLQTDQQSAFNIGRIGEITRDEVKFTKFIKRLRNKFTELFYELIRIQLLLKGKIKQDEWQEIKEQIKFDFVVDTYFAELKDAEILKERINTANMVLPLVESGFYSKEFVRKNILKQSDDDIKDIDSQRKKEKEDEAAANPMINNGSIDTPDMQAEQDTGQTENQDDLMDEYPQN